jgi:hypothetical protein
MLIHSWHQLLCLCITNHSQYWALSIEGEKNKGIICGHRGLRLNNSKKDYIMSDQEYAWIISTMNKLVKGCFHAIA